MKVKLIRENEDGSADFSFDLTPEESQALVCHGIVKALEQFIKEGEKYVASEAGVGNTGSGGQNCVYGTCEQSCEPGQPCNGSEAAGLSD